MPFTRIGVTTHAQLTGVEVTQHHTATVGGDINLADLAARAHTDLSDAPADAHHNQAHALGTHANSQATQAAIEAETDEDTYTPPDLLRFAPSSVKMWCKWQVDGTIDGSFNVTSVTDTGVGDWSVVIDTDFSSVTLQVAGAACETTLALIARIAAPAVATMDVDVVDTSNVKTDPIRVYCWAFGDL